MKLPRAVMRPSIWPIEDAGMVCIRTPTSEPDTYYETVLTPDEAHLLGLELMIDADRAKRWRNSQEFLKRSAAKRA